MSQNVFSFVEFENGSNFFFSKKKFTANCCFNADELTFSTECPACLHALFCHIPVRKIYSTIPLKKFDDKYHKIIKLADRNDDIFRCV